MVTVSFPDGDYPEHNEVDASYAAAARPGYFEAAGRTRVGAVIRPGDRIEYVYRDLPRGGELRLVTSAPDAIRAIHEFMAFQRDDHRAGGMDHGGHGCLPRPAPPSTPGCRSTTRG